MCPYMHQFVPWAHVVPVLSIPPISPSPLPVMAPRDGVELEFFRSLFQVMLSQRMVGFLLPFGFHRS